MAWIISLNLRQKLNMRSSGSGDDKIGGSRKNTAVYNMRLDSI